MTFQKPRRAGLLLAISVACCGQISAFAAVEPAGVTKPEEKSLQATIAVTDKPPTDQSNPTQLISKLMQIAEDRDENKGELDRKGKFHKQKWTKAVARSKEMLEFATSYQGFESSSEGADIILGEKYKMKSSNAVELIKQRRADAAHVQLTAAMMEVATGLGMSDSKKRDAMIESGRQEMVPLVGDDAAKETIQSMTDWSKQLTVADSVYNQDTWDVLTLRKKSTQMLADSMGTDDVVKSIETRLHKYNHRSNFARVAAKVINTGCSIASWSPTFAAPAAQAAEFIFVAATGGPEEKKLLKEIYLDRCFATRFERLSQETQMALNSYNNAVLTKNPVLLTYSQAMIENMTSEQTAKAIVAPQDSAPELSTAKAAANPM